MSALKRVCSSGTLSDGESGACGEEKTADYFGQVGGGEETKSVVEWD